MEHVAPPAKRIRLNDTTTFDVVVGSALHQERFSVHTDAFCRCSAFLRAARSDHCRGDAQKSLRLTAHDPDTFAAYVKVVYADILKTAAPELSPFSLRNTIWDRALHLAKLWVLADEIQDENTAELVLDEWIKSYFADDDFVTLVSVVWAYNHTLPGMRLRTVVGRACVHHARLIVNDETWTKRLPYELWPEVLNDCTKTGE